MESMEEVLRNATEENQAKTDWTKAWSGKYPVLGAYQKEVDVPRYAGELRTLLNRLETEYGYSPLDAMLVLKDILYHEYMDGRKQ